jgi:CHAT domain-containing protein
VLLVGPHDDLPGVAAEVADLTARYRAARVLGPATTSAEVLAALPTASLLHVASHAVVHGSPDESYLALAEHLPVRTILEHAAARAVDAPGQMVVLSACSSDLTMNEYDEALTLATAFLAAGASTVVASRWVVNDRGTAVLMQAFHHFLGTGLPAADALRAAQLWLLEPERPVLAGASVPAVRRAAFADVSVWAAFGHQGR